MRGGRENGGGETRRGEERRKTGKAREERGEGREAERRREEEREGRREEGGGRIARQGAGVEGCAGRVGVDDVVGVECGAGRAACEGGAAWAQIDGHHFAARLTGHLQVEELASVPAPPGERAAVG